MATEIIEFSIRSPKAAEFYDKLFNKTSENRLPEGVRILDVKGNPNLLNHYIHIDGGASVKIEPTYMKQLLLIKLIGEDVPRQIAIKKLEEIFEGKIV